MLRNMGPLFIFLLLISCGEKKSIQHGVTTKSALIEIKGEPLKVQDVPTGEVLIYKDNETFQLTDKVVSASFHDPVGDERNVLFWRHSFRDCETRERAISEEAIPEMELSCASRGLSVVFVKGSGKVTRISEYERK